MWLGRVLVDLGARRVVSSSVEKRRLFSLSFNNEHNDSVERYACCKGLEAFLHVDLLRSTEYLSFGNSIRQKLRCMMKPLQWLRI